MAISDSWLKANHNRPTEPFEKTDGNGLSVRASSAGKLVFQMRYRYQSKPCRVDLGTYPLMTLKAARQEAQRLKAMLEQGHDPRVVKRVEKADIAGAMTNEHLYREWDKVYAQANVLQHKEYLRSFELHVFPEIGDLPADSTSAHTWLNLVEQVKGKSPSIAQRILSTTQQMHRWAYLRNLIKHKPLADVSWSRDFSGEREPAGRAMSPDEIGMFWHCVQATKMSRINQIFLMLCLVMGCRNGELRSLDPRADLGVDTSLALPDGALIWTLPKEKNKARKRIKKAVVRPVAPEIAPLFEEAIRISKSPNLLISGTRVGGYVKSSSTLTMPYNIMRKATELYGGMGYWSMHDLRKTARTGFSSLTDPHVAELMLGHSLKGMQGVYDQYHYLDEMVAAYRKWWSRIHQYAAAVPTPAEAKATGWKPTLSVPVVEYDRRGVPRAPA